MAGPVRIDPEVWSEWRFEALAEAAGYNVYEAVGRIAKLWAVAMDKGVCVMPEAAVRAYLGAKGVEAIVTADLGELADGGVRLKGSKRFEAWWLKREELRQQGSRGGRKSAAGAQREAGQFVPRNTNHQAQHQAADQAIDQALANPPPSIHQPSSSSSSSSSSEDCIGDVREERDRPDKAKAKGSRHVPADFEPTDAHRALAQQLGVDLAFELSKFRDHEFAKSRSDWPAALRNWIRNATPRTGQQRLGVGRSEPKPPEAYGEEF